MKISGLSTMKQTVAKDGITNDTSCTMSNSIMVGLYKSQIVMYIKGLSYTITCKKNVNI